MNDKSICRTYKNGLQVWGLDGMWHREDGPTLTYPDGRKCWYFRNVKHRGDGPAVMCPNGDKEWWLDGKQFSERKFNNKVNAEKEIKKVIESKNSRQ